MDADSRDIEARCGFLKLAVERALSRVTEPWSRIRYCCGHGPAQLRINCCWQLLSGTAVLDIKLRVDEEDVGWCYIADLGLDDASGAWCITDIPWVTHAGHLKMDHAMWAVLTSEDWLVLPEVSLSYRQRETGEWIELPIRPIG